MRRTYSPASVSYTHLDVYKRQGQDVMFITERAVFRIIGGRLTLTEIAPGVDLEKDILSKMEFRPAVSENLQEMDRRLFLDEKMGL